MKMTKSNISKKPFELIGFTLDDYILWCNKNNFKSYKNSSKKEFFKRVNNFIIVKRNNQLFENGEAL